MDIRIHSSTNSFCEKPISSRMCMFIIFHGIGYNNHLVDEIMLNVTDDFPAENFRREIFPSYFYVYFFSSRQHMACYVRLNGMNMSVYSQYLQTYCTPATAYKNNLCIWNKFNLIRVNVLFLFPSFDRIIRVVESRLKLSFRFKCILHHCEVTPKHLK